MTLYFCINKICIWSHVNYSWSCFLHSCIVIFSDLWELMSWHGGRKGGSWGAVKFLCQCPSLTLFLLLAHHVAVLDLWLIYALSYKILGRKKCINSKGILVCQNEKIPEQNTTRNLFLALLLLYLVQLLHLQLEQSFSLSITINVGKLLPNHHPFAGGRGEGWCAGVSGWVLDSGCECVQLCVCPHQGVLLPFLGEAVCVPAPRRMCGHCSAGHCWKCLRVFGSVSLCVHTCVLVCVCFPTLLVSAKRDMAETILSGGNSPWERVGYT